MNEAADVDYPSMVTNWGSEDWIVNKDNTTGGNWTDSYYADTVLGA
jgi:hypothetical protein